MNVGIPYESEFNPGKIIGFMEIDLSSSKPYTKFIDLDSSSISFMGKNGSGKTTMLKKIVDSVLPELKCQPNGEADKYWSGGLVFSPDGLKNDRQEIFIDTTGDLHRTFGRSDREFRRVSDQVLRAKRDADLAWWVSLTTEERALIYRNDYYGILSAEEVFPRQFALSRELRTWEYAWDNQFDSRISNEIVLQNTFLVMMHPQFHDSRFETSFDTVSRPGPLVCRLAAPNDESPRLAGLRNSILEFYEAVAKEKKISYSSIVFNMLHGESPNYPRLESNSLFTPFLLPMQFLGDESNDEEWPSLFKIMVENFPEKLIEWPQERFQAGAEDIIALAADVHLCERKYHKEDTEVELLIKAVNTPALNWPQLLRYPEPNRFWSEENKKKEEEILDLFFDNVRNILNAWDVIPNFQWQFENSTAHNVGYRFSFNKGNLVIDQTGPINDTTKRWIFRAVQCSQILTSISPYKIVIWDEPELGLHPTAVTNIVNKVLPWLKSNGIKLVFATHSAVLGGASARMYMCNREPLYPHRPYLEVTPAISSDILEDCGLTKLDLLANIRNFLIVEGEHDRVVIETIFRHELVENRVKVLTLGGTENLLTLPESEILFEYFDANFVIIVDGKKKSQITEKDRDFFDLINRACEMNSVDKLLGVVDELRDMLKRRKVEDHTEIVKLTNLIHKWAKISSNGKADLSKLRFVMLKESDIMHYLDPMTVTSLKRTLTWKEMRESYHLRQDKKLSEKDFYRKKYNAKINVTSFRRAANQLLDSHIPEDLQNILTLISK